MKVSQELRDELMAAIQSGNEIIREQIREIKEIEAVNHPPHYLSLPAICDKCGEIIECISVVRHFDFSIGNALKYLWRSRYKGNEIEDLKKAVWYIEDRIKQLEG